ncbi:MAG TPA: exonuclease domain-containing protein [Burkholderiaceae bacterium]|nr:exonuclease domain-containing protein [Burkholderiaceae bacterium]
MSVASLDPVSRTPPIAVVDFETTGMGPSQGARATEIAIVLVEDGRITGRYQSLMHTGAWVPPFIEALTGISNAMLRDAPPAAAVMREVAEFTRGLPLVAHNAAFDRNFWIAEMAQAGLDPDPAHRFACTLLLSRRLWPEAPDHKLGTLERWAGLTRDGRAHRAMSDADVTAQLLIRLQRDVAERWAEALGPQGADHSRLCEVQAQSRRVLARGWVPSAAALA